MEEFCRSGYRVFLLTPPTDLALPFYTTVTQIPLETLPREREGPAPNNRPPWVRPVRKKTSSSARSPAGSGDSPLNHGSPEDFQQQQQPTDGPSFIDHLGSPAQTFAAPPQGVQTPQQQQFTLGAQGFADAGLGMMQTDAGPLSTADLMAFLNADPALDMGAILGSPDLGGVGALDHAANGFYHMGTPSAGGGNPLSP